MAQAVRDLGGNRLGLAFGAGRRRHIHQAQCPCEHDDKQNADGESLRDAKGDEGGPADSRTTILESDCPTGVWSLEASPRTTQPCFTVGHALSLRGRAASSAGTVASSLR